MKRLKKFSIYVLLIAAFWIVSDIIIYLSINGTYNDKETKVYISSPKVIVEESKATSINGYIKENIKNNTQEIITDKYLKIDMYSARDVNLGTKYVKIDSLQSNESQEFEMWYEFSNVDYAILTTTNEDVNIGESEFSSRKITIYLLFGKLMMLYFL